MNRIAPLLHRSPRAVKRFVNLYRLIKAGLSTVELDAFLNDGPIPQIRSFEIVLFLLALTTNSPELMPDMLNAIQITLTKKDGRRKANLRQLVDIGLAGSQQTEHDLLRSWMHGLKSDDLAAWADVPLEVLSDHFADVARYSFSSHDV